MMSAKTKQIMMINAVGTVWLGEVQSQESKQVNRTSDEIKVIPIAVYRLLTGFKSLSW